MDRRPPSTRFSSISGNPLGLQACNGHANRQRSGSMHYFRRKLQVEQLEDRRLLAVLPLISGDSLNAVEPEFDVPAERVMPYVWQPVLQNLGELQLEQEFDLQLFPGSHFSAVVKNRSIDVNGTISVMAQLDGYDYAYAYFANSGNSTFASIEIPETGEKYLTRVDPQTGTTYLLQLDMERLDERLQSPPIIVGLEEDRLEDARERPQGDPGVGGRPQRFDGSGSPPGTTQIDVMIVYTPAAKNWANSAEGSINNTIASAMTRSNVASENSNLGIQFNLVYSGEVNYVEAGGSTDLGRLRSQTDGFMDEVHSIRDSVAADMVAILTFTQDTGGVAYLLTDRYGREDLAFSLTRVQQASWTYTFVHELAHNMGASHHKQQSVQAGPTNWSNWQENQWSAGWRWQGTNGNYYTSVMSYSSGQFYADGNNSARVPNFSNPSVSFQGQPTGHPTDGDNARTLREIRHAIGQYRDLDTLQYCTAQGGSTNYGISSVQMGSIHQVSGTANYYDFSYQSTDVRAGNAEQLIVNITNPFWANQLLVWVDWNDDKDFLDTGELVFASGQASVDQYLISVVPPADVSPGPKRMRIRLHMPSFGGNATPCGSSDFGEVQDFRLNVLPREAVIVGASVFHADWEGPLESAIDAEKILAKEGPDPETLGFSNLINTSGGINGVLIDIENLAAEVNSSDFLFQWSPEGAFQESLHPPSGWSSAPDPSSITVITGQTDRVRLEWPQGMLFNRWLRITVLATSNTGLVVPEVYYIGHLLGESTGPNEGVYTVSFSDVAEIRNSVGETVDSSSPFDIDKNGTISFSDIASMRSNVGAQLTNITIGGGQPQQSSLQEGDSDKRGSGRGLPNGPSGFGDSGPARVKSFSEKDMIFSADIFGFLQPETPVTEKPLNTPEAHPAGSLTHSRGTVHFDKALAVDEAMVEFVKTPQRSFYLGDLRRTAIPTSRETPQRSDSESERTELRPDVHSAEVLSEQLLSERNPL